MKVVWRAHWWESRCNLSLAIQKKVAQSSDLHVGVWGFRDAKGLAYTAAEKGSPLILDLFSGSHGGSHGKWSALHCIALHGMIDEARKALKRARNVSTDLDTQRFSSFGCGTRKTAVQSSDSDSDSASTSANTKVHNMI